MLLRTLSDFLSPDHQTPYPQTTDLFLWQSTPSGSGTALRRLSAVGSEKYRFACVVADDGTLAKDEAAHGIIPAEAAAGIEEHAPEASLERAKAIEPGISHDMMARSMAV